MLQGSETCGFSTIWGNQKTNATSDVTGQDFLGIYRPGRFVALELAVFGRGRILCFGLFFAGALRSYCCVEGLFPEDA